MTICSFGRIILWILRPIRLPARMMAVTNSPNSALTNQRVVRISIALAASCLLLPGKVRGQPLSNEQADFFEQKVRPILVNRCLSCHGAKKAKSGLRLDSRAAMLRGGEQGSAVAPGKPEESLLVRAVRYQSDLKMPPTGRLGDKEIADLAHWVSLGAPWANNLVLATPETLARAGSKHWAFRPPARPPLPAVHSRWQRTPIDSFILADLAKTGLRPSAAADRRTLVRRTTFDLIGLPPTPQEVDAFETDRDPNAYEKMIDRLLASPHYGERWARHWLDVARYADDKGYVFFEDKNYPWAFTYRDYVIGAFNRDLPYDRFLLEQLAADQLKLDNAKSLAALGFLTVGGHFMNGTHDIIDDRIDVVTRGLMGLTVACARCHDHKFDPIPQADYYSLYGVFRSCQEPAVPPLLDAPPNTDEFRKQDAELKSHEQKLVDFVTKKHRELVHGARTRAGEYLLAAYATRNLPRDDDFMFIADKGDLNPTMITRWRVYLDETRARSDSRWLPWHRLAEVPEAELAQRSEAILGSLRHDSKVNSLVRQTLPPKIVSMKELAACYGLLLAKVEARWQKAVESSAQAGHGPPAKLDEPDAEQLRRVLYGQDAPADAPLALDWGFLSLFPDRATQDEYKKLLQNLESACRKGPPRAMVLLDAPIPFEPRIFERGQHNRLGEAVPRQFLQVVNPQRQPFHRGSGRLEMAQEIVAKTNPLTARVMVNRIWMHHFGTPLVGTPSDFGLRSDPPSHPALLDWLANEFVAESWSIKHLHRLIMTSAVYMQSSLDRDDGLVADAENRLYWRMNRRRLELEPLHDALLAVSQSLDQTLGGAPVSLFGPKPRRSIYAHVDRLEFPSILSTFDVPNPAASSPRRTATTVSPQALFMMNGAFARDAARRLLDSASLQDCGDTAIRLDRLFLALFGRKPDAFERRWAMELLASGPADRWLDLVHGLLMTNEFVFVD